LDLESFFWRKDIGKDPHNLCGLSGIGGVGVDADAHRFTRIADATTKKKYAQDDASHKSW
jgi:hypothetical protein